MERLCEKCVYLDLSSRIWKCDCPVPCEQRKISEYGCDEFKEGSQYPLSTWEVIKEMSQHNDKKFENLKGTVIYKMGCGIYFNDEDGNMIEYAINIYDNWKEKI